MSIVVVVALLSLASWVNGATIAQKRLSNTVDARSLQGKFLYGYQGFFRRPGQGNIHWTLSGSGGTVPGPSTPGDGKITPSPPSIISIQSC